MGSGLNLPDGVAEDVAGKHEVAGADITALHVPDPPDGGVASKHLGRIISALLVTADDIALLNEAAAAQVRGVGTTYGRTEDSVEEKFRTAHDEAGA